MNKIIALLLLLTTIIFAQLLENQQNSKSIYSIYDGHPNFEYFDKIAKKKNNKGLYQLARNGYFAMDSASAYTLSGRELRAINMVVSNAPGFIDDDPFLESIYVYKLNSEVLYICIELNENEYYMKKNGVFDNTSKKQGKRIRRVGGGGEYLVNVKKMTIIEKINLGDK